MLNATTDQTDMQKNISNITENSKADIALNIKWNIAVKHWQTNNTKAEHSQYSVRYLANYNLQRQETNAVVPSGPDAAFAEVLPTEPEGSVIPVPVCPLAPAAPIAPAGPTIPVNPTAPWAPVAATAP